MITSRKIFPWRGNLMILRRSAPRPLIIRHLIVATLIFSLFLGLDGRSLAAGKRIVLLPLRFYVDESKSYLRQGIKSMLLSRLSGPDLEVVSDDALGSFLTENDRQGITSAKRAEELARQLKAEYAVYGSVTSAGTGYSLDLTVMDLSKGEVRFQRISEAVTEDQLIPKLSDIVYDIRAIIAGVDIRKPAAAPVPEETGRGLFFRPSGESGVLKPSGGFSLRVAVMSMDTGDLEGDGQKELVVLTRQSLMVYKRRQRTYELKGTLEAAYGEEFLKVSVADIDRNGKAEIYLVSSYGKTAQTSVWEWSGKFKKLVDRQRGNYYAVKEQGSGRDALLFQDSGFDQIFMGTLWFASYQNGVLTKKEAIPGLGDAQLYTLTLYDVDKDGTLEFIGLGRPDLYEESPICIWDEKGNVLFQSSQKVGGTNNAIRSGPPVRPDEQPPRVSFNSRVVVADVEKNGKKDLLAVSNIPITKYLDFWLYEKGSLIAYEIQSRSLTELYKSRNIPYCITDMQVDGQTIFLACSKGDIFKFGEGSGRIMWFE
jgi:TolB-like protein